MQSSSNWEKYLDLLSLLPKFEYQWQTFDCFQFANYIRNFYYLSNLPNIENFYKMVTENKAKSLDGVVAFEEILNQETEPVNEVQNFDLVYLQFDGIPCLGTYLFKDVFFLGNQGAKAAKVHILSKWIVGFYRLTEN